jgi:aminoglycoside phosphotransferase (APT) family kinase protein
MGVDLTGRHVRPDRGRLTELLGRAGVAGPAVFEPLSGGTFNTAYRVVAGDRRLVLKIAPSPAAAGLTYERGLLVTEAAFYRAAADALPVPEVVHVDTDRDLLPTDWLVMTELPGVTWFAVQDRLADTHTAPLRRQLGTAVARLHRVTGEEFGYGQLGLSPDWPTAFTAMMDAVLADAIRYGVALPVPAEALRSRLAEGCAALAEVTVPSLVHFDLWPGNVLVEPDPPRVTGVIDGERAFWGDPLAELPSLGLFGSAEDDPDLVAGYRAAGGALELTAATRRRLDLYRVYLYLIMTVEVVPRGATGPDARRLARRVATHLRAAARRLDRAGS